MKVLVNRGIEGITFRDKVTNVSVNLGVCVRVERLINGEGIDLTEFQEYSVESIVDFYESGVPIIFRDDEDLLYSEVIYSIENDTLVECYITNRLDCLFDDIFTAIKNDSLVIDVSKGIKHKIYSGGKVIS